MQSPRTERNGISMRRYDIWKLQINFRTTHAIKMYGRVLNSSGIFILVQSKQYSMGDYFVVYASPDMHGHVGGAWNIF